MRYFPVLLLFVLFFPACKKDKLTKPKFITGVWNWLYTYKDSPVGPDNPLTPANTGITEKMIFKQDGTWKKILDNNVVDSGTYSLGHGTYTAYSGAYVYRYDSVGFYKNNHFAGWDSYEVLTDTLVFNPGLSGRFSSFLVPNNGSKWMIKE
jgi:hypothetical protein